MTKKITKIKAIEIISTFSKEEKKEFKLFLSSPYFNSNSNLLKLYNVILENEDKIAANQFSEKEIYQKLFKTNTYSHGTIRNLMSGLLQMCDDFLITNASRKDPEYRISREMKILKEYSMRYLDSNYHLKYEKLLKQLSYDELGADFFFYKKKLNSSMSKFYWLRGKITKMREYYEDSGALDMCKMISILSESISLMNYMQKHLNYYPKIVPALSLLKNLDLEKFLNDLKGLEPEYYNHITDEINFLKLTVHPDDIDNYYKLKKKIFRNINLYSNSEKYYHTSRLLLFITYHFNKGKLNLVHEICDLRKLQLKSIKYGEDGVDNLPVVIFTDIVDLFLRTEDINFVLNFTKEHLNSVEEVNRDTAFNYAMARIEIQRKNHEKAIAHLSKIEMINTQMKYAVKMLMIQTYYEMGHYEAGLSAIDALKHYMRAEKNMFPPVRERYTYYLTLTEKIYKIKLNPEKYSAFEIDRLYNEATGKIFNKAVFYFKELENLRKLYGKKGKMTLSA